MVPWLDLVIIGLVLALVVSRFFNFKLPTDTRDAAARKAEFDQLFGRRKAQREAYQETPLTEAETDEDMAAAAEAKAAPRRKAALGPRDVAHLEGVEQIKALDPNFDRADFIAGAIAAYGYFYECYNARDQEGIINLCGPQFEQEVLAEWTENPAKIVVESEPKASLQRARLNGRTAVLEVLFTATHRVGKAAPQTVRAVWVFARAVGSPDPNWELQTIQPQADA
ncbi:MAG: TIM44-like domain-containing protein [Alphaproteobacteria bacterium]|nr:TIM44-like domain-containing protein [Alphaproteobacteria bacterium]